MEQCKLIEVNRKKGNEIENPSVRNIELVLSNIPRLLERKLLTRLKEVEENILPCSKKDFLPIAYVYQKICKNFSITREEARQVLYELKQSGYIEFFRFRGIKLKYNLKNDKK